MFFSECMAYVVDMFQYDEKMEAHYARIISSVDLAYAGPPAEVYKTYKVPTEDSFPSVYFHLGDGEEPLTADKYDQTLRALQLEVVLKATKQDIRRGYYNRRYPLLVAMLEHILSNFEDIETFGVVLYGH